MHGPPSADESSGALDVEPIVGRSHERQQFAQALQDRAGLVFVHGPAGVGKSSLVRAMARMASVGGREVRILDSRDFPPSPRSFLDELRAVSGEGAAEPAVVIVDTYELLGAIDDWMQRELWPGLPAGSMLVLAGRTPPSAGWSQAAAARGDRIVEVALRNLGREDALRLLRVHGVADEDRSAAVSVTGGQPLALAMIGDLTSAVLTDGEREDGGVLTHLFRRLLSGGIPVERRRALEAAAIVRNLTEAQLSALLEQRDVRESYAWLESLACMQRSRHGLCPHDFAREMIVSELRWREPAWYDTLVLRAHHEVWARFFQTRAADQVRVLDELSYLHRYNPMAQIGLDWAVSEHYLDEATPADLPVLEAMVERHEGAESAAHVMPWIQRRPSDTIVYRDRVGRPGGFLVLVNLDRATPEQLAADPLSATIWQRLTSEGGPCERGEPALLYRCWMGTATHHAPSPIWNLVAHTMVREGLIRHRLAWSGGLFDNPDFWEPFFAYFNLQRMSGLEFAIGSRRMGLFGIDYRLIPRLEFGNRVAARLAATPTAPVRPLISMPSVLLERGRFAVEVRRALRRLWRNAGHGELRRSPLLHARLVASRVSGRATPTERIAALRRRVEDAIARVVAAETDPRFEAILHATFVEPTMAKGPVVAETLSMSFATYRRMLGAAIRELIDELWRAEVG